MPTIDLGDEWEKVLTVVVKEAPPGWGRAGHEGHRDGHYACLVTFADGSDPDERLAAVATLIRTVMRGMTASGQIRLAAMLESAEDITPTAWRE